MKNNLLKTAAAAALLCLGVAASAQKYHGIVDKTVAVVGNEMITISDIEAQVQAMRAQGAVAERCQVLEGMMQSKLFLAQARVDSLVVNQDQVTAQLDQYTAQTLTMVGGEDNLPQYFGNKPLYKLRQEWRSQIEEQSLVQQEQSEIAKNLPPLTPHDVKAFLDTAEVSSLPVVPIKYQMSQICIYPDREAAAMAVKERLLSIRERIINGERFATLARLYSEDPGSSRKGGNPVLFLVGDSTTRTGTRGNGDNGQWGWGYYAHEWFDEDRITVENHALGGLSCRTFYRDWWPDVIKGVQKGDWVIIQIGHNDSGPYDQPGGRSSIPGTGKETVQVTLRDGRVETVLSYGEYLRRYIDEVRAKGATPLLSTLTPRNQWDNGRVRRKNDSYNIWIREVAAEKNVPVIDLEEISASDFERWSHFKVDYMFYNDNIHSSAYGAAHNAWCMALGIARTDSKLKDYLLPLEQPQQEFVREPGKPALIVTGDSTIQNTDSDPDGMWGWGSVLETVFDPSRITLVNAGKAGRSARTFLNEGRWDKVYNSLQPGDFVVIQFGHNDMGRVGQPPYRAELAGDADESDVVFMANTRQYEVVRSYGWYLRKFIDDVREKGATPILVSLTPRNEWPHGKMERRDDTYGIWVRDVVKQTGVDFVDMHNITADYFDSIGPEATRPYYKNDHTHTSRLGAERNARSFAEGLRKIGHPLAKYLK